MSAENLVDRLKALGEPRRLAIVRLLAGGPRNGVALLADLHISQPNLSRHLAVLREAGLVRERRTGREAIYHLQPDPVLASVLEILGVQVPTEGSTQPGQKKNIDIYASIQSDAAQPRGGEDPEGDSDEEHDAFQDWLL